MTIQTFYEKHSLVETERGFTVKGYAGIYLKNRKDAVELQGLLYRAYMVGGIEAREQIRRAIGC